MSAAGEAPMRERVVRLGPGEEFPALTASLVGGGVITLPDDVRDGWAVILLYRGHWCPYCRQQLTDFQRKLERFTDASTRVVALSADPEPEARATVEDYGIEFPVAYGLEPDRLAQTIGVYLGGEAEFVQATGFVLRPGGEVELAVYSSGAVGRLVADDVLGLIEYARKQD